MKKEYRTLVILEQVAIGAFLIFFFAKWCPLVPYDADDWIYLAYDRLPIPIWGDWNPSRVLPETLMPLVGRISARWIYPLTNDYALAVTWGSAILMAVLITVMCYLVYRVAVHRIGCTPRIALWIELLFLLGCYWIFRNRAGSACLFKAASLCTIYFYTISGIVNAITILLMMQYEQFLKAYRQCKVPVRIGYWLLVYASIYSNLFHSGMLAVYCVSELVLSFLMSPDSPRKDLRRLRQWIVEHRIECTILVAWVIAVLFEFSGGRSGNVSASKEFSLAVAWQQFQAMIDAFHKVFRAAMILSLFVAGYACWRYMRGRRNDRERGSGLPVTGVILLNLILLTAYELLLNAQIHYMSRIEASWGMWFYCVLLVAITLVQLTSRYCTPAMPAVIAMVCVSVIYPDGRYCISDINDVSYEACMATDHLALDGIAQADDEHGYEVTIYIPDYTETDNAWGFGYGYGQTIADALYHNGVIQEPVKVMTISDRSLNEAYE